MTTPASFLTITVANGDPIGRLAVNAVVMFHANLSTAVDEARSRPDTHIVYLLREMPPILTRSVKGAAQYFDAADKADKEAADAAALEAAERAELARLQAKYGVRA